MKNKIEADLISAWQPLFETYTELKAIAVYAWGRYYKYELAGEPFEIFVDERGLSKFKNIVTDADIDWNLLKQIDEKHNKPGSELWTGIW